MKYLKSPLYVSTLWFELSMQELSKRVLDFHFSDLFNEIAYELKMSLRHRAALKIFRDIFSSPLPFPKRPLQLPIYGPGHLALFALWTITFYSLRSRLLIFKQRTRAICCFPRGMCNKYEKFFIGSGSRLLVAH